METLMALSLVMIVERLVDAPSTAQVGSPLANPATASATTDLAHPTNTADEPKTRWPVAGRITQDFHPGHTGTDIAVPIGTPIPTTLAGKVVFAGWNTQGYGNLVIVENGPYRTYYAHLSQIGVKVGDQAAAGTQIGLSGSTGHSTGPHLHYEVRVNGTPVPPQALP
jgi:murein DD-endopeptidase MepM/ murein hydrolase activator NlpD